MQTAGVAFSGDVNAICGGVLTSGRLVPSTCTVELAILSNTSVSLLVLSESARKLSGSTIALNQYVPSGTPSIGIDWPGSLRSYSSTAPIDNPRSVVGSEHDPSRLPSAPAFGMVES